ncbi:MAG: phage tail tube protein [bacterium]|nr:phage tail tube protein [bacterium]
MRGQRDYLDVSELCTGKDGRLYVEVDGKNYFLAEINEFNVKMTVNTTKYQGAGSMVNGTVPTGVEYELTATEALIRDDLTMNPIVEAISQGYFPVFNFQGVVMKPNGRSSQKVAFNNAIPSGDFDIMKVQPGEVITRQLTFALNSIPKYIAQMAATNNYGYSK